LCKIGIVPIIRRTMQSSARKKSDLLRYDPILLNVICPLAALGIKLLILSCRLVRIEGEGEERKALAQNTKRGDP